MTTEFRYPGHGFYPAFKNGRASGELIISATEVRFSNAQASVCLALDGARFSLGGASDRLLFISHPSHPDWKLYTTERSILDNPYLQQWPQIQVQLKKAKQVHRMNWSIFAGVALLIVLVPALLVLNMHNFTAMLARQVPQAWEQKLGDEVFKQYKADGHFMDQTDASALLQPLVQPLLDANPDQRFDYHFYISRDDEINAFALPGGYVVINSGLILKAETPEELLGVVAHEISHVTQQHSIRNIMGTAGIYLTVNAMLGDMTGLLALIADAAPYLINQSYSRNFETEADTKGVALLQQAQIDPEGLKSFFAAMLQEEQRKQKEMADDDNQELARTTLSILSTHPATEDRIAHLQELIKDQPRTRYRDLDEPFLHLQDAIKKYITNTDKE